MQSKKETEKEKKINYYIKHYRNNTKAEIAKNLGVSVNSLNGFILRNCLPVINEHTKKEIK